MRTYIYKKNWGILCLLIEAIALDVDDVLLIILRIYRSHVITCRTLQSISIWRGQSKMVEFIVKKIKITRSRASNLPNYEIIEGNVAENDEDGARVY